MYEKELAFKNRKCAL